jgi:hypothetical protein
MDKEQTAVEYYPKEHLRLMLMLENKEISLGEYAVQHQELLEQAKAMEKDQIIDAIVWARDPYGRTMGPDILSIEKGEKYYNQIFKS